MRLPLLIRPGGKAGLANMEGGGLVRSSGSVYDVAQVTPVFFWHAGTSCSSVVPASFQIFWSSRRENNRWDARRFLRACRRYESLLSSCNPAQFVLTPSSRKRKLSMFVFSSICLLRGRPPEWPDFVS